jgi:hypothetical protein
VGPPDGTPSNSNGVRVSGKNFALSRVAPSRLERVTRLFAKRRTMPKRLRWEMRWRAGIRTAFEPLDRFRAFARSSIEAGAGDEARTRDINLGKVALYQLSYTRTCEARKIARRLQTSMREFPPNGLLACGASVRRG